MFLFQEHSETDSFLRFASVKNRKTVKGEEPMMKTLIGFTIALLCLALSASATVRYVSAYGGGDYTTLSAAYTAAVSGDTILIGPGTYSEGTLTSSKRLAWIGAGWDQSKVTFSSYFAVSTTAANGSLVEGLRIESGGSYTIWLANNVDSVTVRRCLIKSTYSYASVLQAQGGRLYVEDCILIQGGQYSFMVLTPSAASLFRGCVFAWSPSTGNYACFDNTYGTAGTLEIYNCVFLNQYKIFNLTSGAQPVIAVNNIFYDWRASPTFGTYPGASTFDYNASSTITAPGTNTIEITDDPFVYYDEDANYEEGVSDLHLVPESGLIDTGHPELQDPDETRSDFGAYGGPHPLVDNGVPIYPWAVDIILTPNLVGQGTDVNATAVGRIGPQY
jgi:hypothetical protein